MRRLLTPIVLLSLAVGYMAGLAWPLTPVVPAAAPASSASASAAGAAPAETAEGARMGGPAADAEASGAAPAGGSGMPEGLTSGEQRVIEVFRNASDSVVFVTNIALRRNFFSLDVMQIPQNTGSGFVWDKDGHVVTNFHVIEGGRAFAVTLADQSTWEAEVVGYAPDKDLAVLRIGAPREKLVPLPVGESHNLAVGQTVLAVGNPFGLDHTLTVGVVSALGREIEAPNGRSIRDIIQTDAAINPGNSGGPLLDSIGKLIGVNSAIYSPSGASAGIGFAVPVDTVARLVPQLIEHGEPIQPGIGIRILPDSTAGRLGLEGVVVRDVAPGGPAEKAGIEGLGRDRSGRILLGDVIVAVDGKEIRGSDDLMHSFESRGVGARIKLTLERDGRRRDATLGLISLD